MSNSQNQTSRGAGKNLPKVGDSQEQLASFIAKYTPETAEMAQAALQEMRKLFPTALELVYDNYNALAIGFGPTERASEAIFSIAVFPRWVSLFFLQAKGLPDPNKILKGSGSVAKHVVLSSHNTLNEPAVKSLMHEAMKVAKVPFDPQGTHRLIIKSVSATQRPRRPAADRALPAIKPKAQAKSRSKNVSARQT